MLVNAGDGFEYLKMDPTLQPYEREETLQVCLGSCLLWLGWIWLARDTSAWM